MFNMFIESFYVTFFAVLKILIVVSAAGILVRRQIITQDNLKTLSSSVVKVFLPCLIFSNIVKTFNPSELKIWPMLPLSAVLMVGMGVFAGFIVFYRELPAKKNMLALTGMQNAGYFVLPMGAVLFADQLEKFNLYCFLFVLGINLLVWSVGKSLVSNGNGNGSKFDWRELITPPLVANLSSLFMVFTGLRAYLPNVVTDSADLLGQATVPIALFVLGGMLGGLKMQIHHYWVDALKVIGVKLFFIPAATILVIYLFKVGVNYPLLASFLVLEAASAPAIANLLQVKHYGGQEEKISTILLLSYFSCIVTVPLWMALWQIISQA
jgi:predicted permease